MKFYNVADPARTITMYAVDTTIFNQLVKGHLDPSDLPADAFYSATHVQRDELDKTPDPDLRERLRAMFESLVDVVQPTESAALGVSRLGACKLSDGVLVRAIQRDLDARNKKRSNNVRDALLAETAIKNGFTLLTGDRDLAEVTERHGGSARYFPRP